MKYAVASINDEKYSAFLERASAAFGTTIDFERQNVTPETLPEAYPLPGWWEAPADRWALTAALMTALDHAAAEGKNLCWFEDDALFVDDFKARFNDFVAALPEDWDMAYLGGQLIAAHLYPLKESAASELIAESKNVHRFHAALFRKECIPRILTWFQEPYWAGPQTCDWRIGYLQMQDDFHTYIPRAGWLCGQKGGVSQLDNIEYPDRWWHFNEPEATEEKARWEAFAAAKKEQEERARFEAWKAEMEAKRKQESQG